MARTWDVQLIDTADGSLASAEFTTNNRSFEQDRERAIHGQTFATAQALRLRASCATNGHA